MSAFIIINYVNFSGWTAMKKIIGFLSVVLLMCFLLSIFSCGDSTNSVNNTEAISKEERLAWFKDAKFGLFIHWGPYSRLAGEWNGKQVPVGQNAEWVMKKLKIPVTEYRKLATQFNPVLFNADEWVNLAKNTGMKYLVITAKHHDGFAMYHSQVSDYNIVDSTPFKRDPMSELAKASQNAGIRFCFYYSHREDWDHPDAYGNEWDYDESQQDFERYLNEKSKPQLRELLTNYGPLGLIWFDRGMYTQEQGNEFVSIVRELQPRCLVNGRVGNYDKELLGDYQNLGDNGMPIGGIEEYWETPQTLNHTWGYSRFDNNWRTSEEVIRRLVKIVSKGGNYLLNIGPKGDGTIPPVSVDILNKVGDWMKLNGESIYGTTASPFHDLPWGRCTVKGEKLYLHVFNWPSNGRLTVKGLNNKVKEVYQLADDNSKLKFTQTLNTLTIGIPKNPVDPASTVIVLDIDGKPDVQPPVVDEDLNNTINLDYVTALTGGKTVKRFNVKGNFHVSKWTGPDDTITWHFTVATPGIFNVLITYAAQEEWQDSEYLITVGEQKLTAHTESTGDWYDYKIFNIGKTQFDKPGKYTLTIKPKASMDHYLMYFKDIRLVRESVNSI